MNKMYGLLGLQVKRFSRTLAMVDKVNEFLKEHDGNIVDIQLDDGDIMIVYVDKEDLNGHS